MDKRVADALRGMGVDPKAKERKEVEERGRVSPKVAAVLEGIGVRYAPEQIQGNPVTEESPLNMPGAAPMVQPPAKGAAPSVQTKPSSQTPEINQAAPDAKPKPQAKPTQPNVQLRSDMGSGAPSTLKDLSDQLTGVTQSMKTIDLLIQSFSEAGDNDQSVQSNKDALRAVMVPFFKKVDALRRAMEA